MVRAQAGEEKLKKEAMLDDLIKTVFGWVVAMTITHACLAPFQRRGSGASYDDIGTRSTPPWLLATTGVCTTTASVTLPLPPPTPICTYAIPPSSIAVLVCLERHVLDVRMSLIIMLLPKCGS